MVQKVTEKITRERLRALQNGEQITVQCADGYDLDSQKKHRLRYAENGKLPICLQVRRLNTNRYAL